MKRILFILLFTLGMLNANICDKKTFSLNTYDIQSDLTLMDVVADLTRQCKITVVFTDKRSRERLKQSLSLINIDDYSLEQLFRLIFNENNLFYDYNKAKNMLKVSYYKMRNFNVNYINASELTTKSTKSITVGTNPSSDDDSSSSSSGGDNANSDVTEVILASKFTFWDKLKDHIEQILKTDEDYSTKTNKVLINRDAAIVTVTGTKRQLGDIEEYLEIIQKRMHKQVMINAHIIELTYADSNNTGVDWSKFEINVNPSASFFDQKGMQSMNTWSFAASFDPSAVIKFLNTYGDVEVVSNPKILTLNNQPAVINVGDQLNYRYQSGDIGTTSNGNLSTSNTYNLGSMFVGLTLNIIPEVTENGQIIMRINPVTSALLEDVDADSTTSSSTSTDNSSRQMPPDTKIKQMSSIVKVKDGQKVMIGGLIEKRVKKENSKVPVLGSIPLLSYAFSSTKAVTERTELFIILTPTLIKNNNFPSLDDAIRKRIR